MMLRRTGRARENPLTPAGGSPMSGRGEQRLGGRFRTVITLGRCQVGGPAAPGALSSSPGVRSRANADPVRYPMDGDVGIKDAGSSVSLTGPRGQLWWYWQ